MNSAGVNMENVEFILGSTDSYWTRYRPWWIVDGNGDIGVDFTYNRPRPNDNNAPIKVSNHLDVPYYSADFISTGVNYMTDGFGISASTQHIAYTEQPECNTNDQNSVPLPSCSYVDDILLDYYGIDITMLLLILTMNIDHIDCWWKFLSPSKLLLRSVPSNHSQYNDIEEVAEYFSSILTSQGTPWEIFRVYTPNDQPYTNSLILNNKVFVPVMNSSWDDEALEVYESALPDYEVLPFTGSWQSTDALHCRVKGIPDLIFAVQSWRC